MTILTNLKIWDGVADDLIEADTLEIDQGRIIRLGELADFDRSSSQDMGGMYVIPGLIDAHVHMCLNPEIKDPLEQDKPSREQLKNDITERAYGMLAAGITTARDLGGGQWIELEVRNEIDSGVSLGTRLICAGQPVTSVKGHCHFWGGEAEDLDAALEVVQRQLDHDVDLIKVMATGGNLTPGSRPVDAQFDVSALKAIVSSAGENERHVAAHCHGTSGIRNAAHAGVTTIEHCSWVGEEGWARDFDEETCKEIARRGIWVSPTINSGWKRNVGSKSFEPLLQGNYRRMREVGVKLIASTDAGIPNVFHHDLPRALPIFAHFAGLSNVETLKAATSDCARAIGLERVAGQLAAGLSADCIFFESDPLADLVCLESPARVMSRGSFV